MKRFIPIILAILLAIVGFFLYQSNPQLRTSVKEGEAKGITYVDGIKNWYQKTNKVVSPLPYFSIHILDFLSGLLGAVFTIWLVLYFFSHQQK